MLSFDGDGVWRAGGGLEVLDSPEAVEVMEDEVVDNVEVAELVADDEVGDRVDDEVDDDLEDDDLEDDDLEVPRNSSGLIAAKL